MPGIYFFYDIMFMNFINNNILYPVDSFNTSFS